MSHLACSSPPVRYASCHRPILFDLRISELRSNRVFAIATRGYKEEFSLGGCLNLRRICSMYERVESAERKCLFHRNCSTSHSAQHDSPSAASIYALLDNRTLVIQREPDSPSETTFLCCAVLKILDRSLLLAHYPRNLIVRCAYTSESDP
jgi:hypothetical protein